MQENYSSTTALLEEKVTPARTDDKKEPQKPYDLKTHLDQRVRPEQYITPKGE